MGGEEERRLKRTKFDERPRKEGRRSASPSRRSSSTIARESSKSDTAVIEKATEAKATEVKATEAKAKAAAAAARLSAMLKTTKSGSEASKVVPRPPSSSPAPPRPPPDDVNEEGLYVRDIQVNDIRNRYLLVKEPTILEIRTKTSADVEVRGKYYPDKTLATERDPPLFLHITSKTKNVLEAAIGMVNKLINQDLGPLVDERRFRKKEDFERDEYGRRKWPEEKCPIGLAPLRGFHLRAAVVGPVGAHVKYIQTETKTKVQIKGQGSGYEEPAIGSESDEPMYLHITGPDQADVSRAKQMCEDLIASVKQQYEEHIQGPPKTDAATISIGFGGPPPPGITGGDPYAATQYPNSTDAYSQAGYGTGYGTGPGADPYTNYYQQQANPYTAAVYGYGQSMVSPYDPYAQNQTRDNRPPAPLAPPGL